MEMLQQKLLLMKLIALHLLQINPVFMSSYFINENIQKLISVDRMMLKSLCSF